MQYGADAAMRAQNQHRGGAFPARMTSLRVRVVPKRCQRKLCCVKNTARASEIHFGSPTFSPTFYSRGSVGKIGSLPLCTVHHRRANK
jgi:hypothetical protein